MIPRATSQVLALADSGGWQSCVAKGRDERGGDGQFFTPPVIARCLAGWFRREGFNRPSLHLLDPGAGGGVLTAAVVDRITALRADKGLRKLKEMTLEAWELEEAFLPALRRTLAACAAALEQVGVRTTVELHHGSYVEGAVRALDPGLFGVVRDAQVTHAILNPPYRKIATRSKERMQLASVGMETSNLYAAFVWLALRQLVPGGELAAITPRSFCNGPYFREFRLDLLDESTFRRVHVFNSRTEAFSRDEVLQENILFHLSRDSQAMAPLTVSTGSLAAPEQVRVTRERFVSLADPNRVIHIATETDASDVRTFFDAMPCKLTDLGIEVSTGPVVDFRLKDSLADHLGAGGVPLIYPHCVKAGRVLAPLQRSSDYNAARVSKKPVAIGEDEETRKWLIPAARLVLIKRFSSKEEKRRLVAGVLDPADFPSGLLGIENHLNFFHCKRAGLSILIARGLCRFLNSTVADRYFRQFNGHTQVNASDLRSFRYPHPADLERLGKLSLDDTQQNAIDQAMTDLLGAPTFSEP
jgi:adenine-specific DNA-methyltransferase